MNDTFEGKTKSMPKSVNAQDCKELIVVAHISASRVPRNSPVTPIHSSQLVITSVSTGIASTIGWMVAKLS